MSFLKKNNGFTLVELIVTIAVGSIVTLAASTVLLLGLRIYNNANNTALKQNEIRAGITVIENLVAEAKVKDVSDNAVIADEYADALVSQSGTSIVTHAGAQILSDVQTFSVDNDGNLLSFEITMVDGAKYTFSVYCRRAEIESTDGTGNNGDDEAPQSGDAVSFSLTRTTDLEAVLSSTLEEETLTPHVRTFLNTLASQLGSTGRILTEDGEGEYYSEWYIDNYEANAGWSSETPWCACYVSWALEECCGYLSGETPRYANVDTFWADMVTSGNWKTEAPEAGDIVFFDWITDREYNPQHVGVVVSADDSRVYTIEGNTDGMVALRSYLLEDAHILGYGLLNWTN